VLWLPAVLPDSITPRLIAVVLVVVTLFGVVFIWRLRAEPGSATPTTISAQSAQGGSVGYLLSRDETILSDAPGAAGQPIAGGIIFPMISEATSGFEVLDTCNRPGWVAPEQVDTGLVPSERGRQMDQSVFVIDPGHGGRDLGAVGPSGLTEAEVNLDVSARIVEMLETSHDIDWATGAVTAGTGVGSAGVAIMTRYPTGPNEGDYELGLTFRSVLANAVDATALVSVHHNTEPTIDLERPGSSAFVSANDDESPRLGGLIVEEVRRSLSAFEADWVGGDGDGLTARVDADGSDYYSILARSEVTAVIVEGAYISNPSEEELIATEAFRQAYAEGVYRGLVRFVTTDDYPMPAPDPELYDIEAPPRSMNACVVGS